VRIAFYGAAARLRFHTAKAHIRHAYHAAVTAGDGRANAKTYQVHHATVGRLAAERSRLILDATDKPGRKVTAASMRQR
jgi:hypothetical protein